MLAAPLVEFRDVSKIYPNGTLASDGVSFAIEPGEIHAIVGENGAGKSTVMKLLYGLERPNAGQILLSGMPVDFRHPRDAISAGIGLVAQHLSLVPSFTAAENIVLGHEPHRGALVDRDRMVSDSLALAESFGLEIEPQARVGDLALGQRQRIEILKTLYRGARLLLLDEPTAVLTPQEIDGLFLAIRRLVAGGITVVIITHKLAEVKAISDRVTVLRAGRVTGGARTRDLDERAIAEMMVGRSPAPLPVRRTKAGAAEPVVEARDLSFVNAQGSVRLRNVSLTIAAGEVLGVAGVEGNGQNSLAQILSGIADPCAGEGRIRGQIFTGRGVRHARHLGVAAISEDRHLDGVAAEFSIAENLVATDYFQPPQSRFGLLRPRTIARKAQDLIRRFGVRAASPAARIGALSGGNMQKIVMAREIAGEPLFLIASQPTRGVDIGAAQFLRSELLALRDRGAAILLISADLEEILALSDRIAVLFKGEITARFQAGAADERELGLYMTGLQRQPALSA